MTAKYDTNSQYWAPPGFAPFKDEKHNFIGYLINIILVFLIDSFLIHSIAAPANIYTSNDYPFFSATELGPKYEDATFLSRRQIPWEKEIVIIEKDGEVHLLLYDFSAPLFRLCLQDDKVLEKDYSGTVRIGKGLFFVDAEISMGSVIEDYSAPFAYNANLYTYFGYIVVGVLCGVIESYLYALLKYFLSGKKKE